MRTASKIRTIDQQKQKNNEKERSKITTMFKQVIQTVQIVSRCVQYRKPIVQQHCASFTESVI